MMPLVARLYILECYDDILMKNQEDFEGNGGGLFEGHSRYLLGRIEEGHTVRIARLPSEIPSYKPPEYEYSVLPLG
jgi:hypothetical protein